jgi:hypothetical protein
MCQMKTEAYILDIRYTSRLIIENLRRFWYLCET